MVAGDALLAPVKHEAGTRPALHRFLGPWREAIAALPEAGRTRWSLDVDPLELF
jgi:primosomal protein N' (replication factor Y)